MDLTEYENKFKLEISKRASAEDPAHDFLHFYRVASMAKKLCKKEDAKLEVVLPSAWLHDYVVIPKNSHLRSQASRLSAEAAIEFLRSIDYPQKFYQEIFHAIEAHSFSAHIEARTVEAKIVQDADRLDGLGAIGVARCFATAGMMKRSFYSSVDPFCEARMADDSQFTVDHFFKKLFKVAETLKTTSAQAEGKNRVQVMRGYLDSLRNEIIV